MPLEIAVGEMDGAQFKAWANPLTTELGDENRRCVEEITALSTEFPADEFERIINTADKELVALKSHIGV
jgi:hypothetical protein